MHNVTLILHEIQRGEPGASEQLLPLVYLELRRLAAIKMSKEPVDLTLQATALVHEAYLRLVGDQASGNWNSRGHFFAAAAEAMRRILIEHARQRKSLKQGGHFTQIPLDNLQSPETDRSIDLLDLDEALVALEDAEPEKAKLVKLRFFAGLSLEETAELMGVSLATAKRHWAYARAWLYGRIRQK